MSAHYSAKRLSTTLRDASDADKLAFKHTHTPINTCWRCLSYAHSYTHTHMMPVHLLLRKKNCSDAVKDNVHEASVCTSSSPMLDHCDIHQCSVLTYWAQRPKQHTHCVWCYHFSFIIIFLNILYIKTQRFCVVLFGHLFRPDTTLAIFAQTHTHIPLHPCTHKHIHIVLSCCTLTIIFSGVSIFLCHFSSFFIATLFLPDVHCLLLINKAAACYRPPRRSSRGTRLVCQWHLVLAVI